VKVYVVIELTGTAAAADGAVIHGVFRSYETAAHLAADIRYARRVTRVSLAYQSGDGAVSLRIPR
jgi:hypothetical protein